MYKLIIYYTGPQEEVPRWRFGKLKHVWHFNPQLYGERSSSPIWNGGVGQVKFNADEQYMDTLENALRREVEKIIAGGIQIDSHGQFVVGPESIEISLESED